MEFEMTFRPSAPDGTLLYSDDAGSGDFLAISLVDGYVEFGFDCGSGGATIRFEDSQIHMIFRVLPKDRVRRTFQRDGSCRFCAAGAWSRSAWTPGTS